MHRQESITKDLEITPKTKGRFIVTTKLSICANLEGRPKKMVQMFKILKKGPKILALRAQARDARLCLQRRGRH
jgi:hypothetical protein